jgi:hypothetical protein
MQKLIDLPNIVALLIMGAIAVVGLIALGEKGLILATGVTSAIGGWMAKTVSVSSSLPSAQVQP